MSRQPDAWAPGGFEERLEVFLDDPVQHGVLGVGAAKGHAAEMHPGGGR
jgi:hypothetical protein